MFRQRLAALQLHNLPRPLAEIIPDKLGIFDLAEEADALAVLALATGQAPLARQLSHFDLAQVTEGEPKPAKLFLI